MKEYRIRENEAGQRLDKYLGKLLGEAPKSFLYKMLRKKNITLNRKKASGSEILSTGDLVILFFSEETIEHFSIHGQRHGLKTQTESRQIVPSLNPGIIYEDADVLLFNKPAGLLSQGDKSGAPSLVDYLTEHLLSSGALTEAELVTFHPGICNRLDRNTSGIVTAGKSLAGLQDLSVLFRERRVRKLYLCLCCGIFDREITLEGYLKKDTFRNKAAIQTDPAAGSEYIKTRYTPLAVLESSESMKGGPFTLLEAELFTGRSHQIRAQLSNAGHPLVGDIKYGGKNTSVQRQLLHGYKLVFPAECARLVQLSDKSFTAPLPEDFSSILKELHFEESRIYERQE